MPLYQPLIFLSYAKEDRRRITPIYSALRKAGLRPWMDKPPRPWKHEGILLGDDWNATIHMMMRKVAVVLAFLSKRSVKKRSYVRREYLIALDLSVVAPIRVIPVLLERCDVPADLRAYTVTFHDFQWHEQYHSSIDELVALLRNILRSRLREVTRVPAQDIKRTGKKVKDREGEIKKTKYFQQQKFSKNKSLRQATSKKKIQYQYVNESKQKERQRTERELRKKRIKAYQNEKSAHMAFYKAIAQGDVAKASSILDKYPKFSTITRSYLDNRRPLHWLSERGKTESIRLLLEKGVNPNSRDKNLQTALHCALSTGHLKASKLLLAKGTDINAKDRKGRTALHQASLNGRYKVAKFLLENGAEINTEDKYGWTPLQCAVSKDYDKVATLLLEKGATKNSKSDSGLNSPLKDILLGHRYTFVPHSSTSAMETINEIRYPSHESASINIIRKDEDG